MKIILISQDGQSIWDYSQCYIFIPKDKICEIRIEPYGHSKSAILASYEDPDRTSEELNKLNILIQRYASLLKPRCFITNSFEPHSKRKLKKYALNYDIIPTANECIINYQFPKDEDQNEK